MRTPEGERVLDEGDIVAFPAGRSGAHCAYNDSKEPVRYLMLSTMNAPDVVAYPDSGKVGVINRPPGLRRRRGRAGRLVPARGPIRLRGLVTKEAKR